MLYSNHCNGFRVMVFKATFNNISAISSVLLAQETEYLEKTTELPQVTDKIYHIMLYPVHPTLAGFELTMLLMIGTDCIGSKKSNYHMITTTTAPVNVMYGHVDFMFFTQVTSSNYLDSHPCITKNVWVWREDLFFLIFCRKVHGHVKNLINFKNETTFSRI